MVNDLRLSSVSGINNLTYPIPQASANVNKSLRDYYVFASFITDFEKMHRKLVEFFGYNVAHIFKDVDIDTSLRKPLSQIILGIIHKAFNNYERFFALSSTRIEDFMNFRLWFLNTYREDFGEFITSRPSGGTNDDILNRLAMSEVFVLYNSVLALEKARSNIGVIGEDRELKSVERHIDTILLYNRYMWYSEIAYLLMEDTRGNREELDPDNPANNIIPDNVKFTNHSVNRFGMFKPNLNDLITSADGAVLHNWFECVLVGTTRNIPARVVARMKNEFIPQILAIIVEMENDTEYLSFITGIMQTQDELYTMLDSTSIEEIEEDIAKLGDKLDEATRNRLIAEIYRRRSIETFDNNTSPSSPMTIDTSFITFQKKSKILKKMKKIYINYIVLFLISMLIVIFGIFSALVENKLMLVLYIGSTMLLIVIILIMRNGAYAKY